MVVEALAVIIQYTIRRLFWSFHSGDVPLHWLDSIMDLRLFLTEFILASKSSIPNLMRRIFHCIAALNTKFVDDLVEPTLMYVPL